MHVRLSTHLFTLGAATYSVHTCIHFTLTAPVWVVTGLHMTGTLDGPLGLLNEWGGGTNIHISTWEYLLYWPDESDVSDSNKQVVEELSLFVT